MATRIGARLRIDHTKVPNTDQSNFPVLISGTYSYLATISNGGNVQNANGYDVIFTSDAACATKLDHEVETYNAVTGAVNYWVRIPSLSHTTDTTIYLCYGNSAITTNQSNKSGVWDSNFKAVYHLNDQAANTTVVDATANGSNGANGANTSGKSVSGKFGQALNYNGSSDNTTTGVTQTTSFTWECWFKLTDWTTQSGSSNYSTLMSGVYPSGGPLLMLWKDSGWLVQFASDNIGGVTSGASSVAPGSWHHAAYTRTGNSGTYTLYLDGDWKGQVASGTNNGNSTITLGNSGYAYGGLKLGTAKITIDISMANDDGGSIGRGLLLLHEDAHEAGAAGYSDRELAIAAHQTAWAQGYQNIPTPPRTNADGPNSQYVTQLIFQACHPNAGKRFRV